MNRAEGADLGAVAVDAGFGCGGPQQGHDQVNCGCEIHYVFLASITFLMRGSVFTHLSSSNSFELIA